MKKNQNTVGSVTLIFVFLTVLGIALSAYPTPVDARPGAGGYSHGSASAGHYPSYSSRGRGVHYYGGWRHPGYFYRGRHYPYYYRGWHYPFWRWPYFVTFLPPYCTTIWISGYPYYYADGIYYVQRPGGYEVVEPQEEVNGQEPAAESSPPVAGKLFIYPRNGQNDKQQADDRYQCHRWAVSQTGYDPTSSSPKPSVTQPADYQRAMAACLEARGYTVR